MKKFILLTLIFLLTSVKCSLEDCVAIGAISCEKLEEESEIPDEYEILGFQTPPRNNALGNYVSTYQDMRYLVSWAELTYNSAKNGCNLKFNTKVNPDLGTEGEDYYIYYTIGGFDEQEFNEISLNSKDHSYPNG